VLCFLCFVCLRPVSCVENVANVSELSVLDCPFCSLYSLLDIKSCKKKQHFNLSLELYPYQRRNICFVLRIMHKIYIHEFEHWIATILPEHEDAVSLTQSDNFSSSPLQWNWFRKVDLPILPLPYSLSFRSRKLLWKKPSRIVSKKQWRF